MSEAGLPLPPQPNDPWHLSPQQLAECLHPLLPTETFETLKYHELSGRTFLTDINHPTLRDEIGIKQFGRRADVLQLVDQLRARSAVYRDYVARNTPLPEQETREIVKLGGLEEGVRTGLGLLDKECPMSIVAPFGNGTETVRIVRPDGSVQVGGEARMEVDEEDLDGWRTRPPEMGGGGRRLVEVLKRETLEGGGEVWGSAVLSSEMEDVDIEVPKITSEVHQMSLDPNSPRLPEDPEIQQHSELRGSQAPADFEVVRDSEPAPPPVEELRSKVTVDENGKKRVAMFTNVMDQATLHAEIEKERQLEEEERRLEEQADVDVLNSESLPEQLPQQTVIRKRQKYRYFGPKARKIDDLFYDGEVGKLIPEDYEDDDDFSYCSHGKPPGERRYVARQIKRLHLRLDKGEGQLITEHKGHLRGAVMYHEQIPLLKKWEHLSFTVIDVKKEGKRDPTATLRREDTTTLRLPWTGSWMETADKTAENPFAQPELPAAENDDWDYLLKWCNIEDDGEAWGSDGLLGDEINHGNVDSDNESHEDAEGVVTEVTTSTVVRYRLTPQQIQEALDEGVDELIHRWKQKNLPRLEAKKAYGIWRKAKRRKERKATIVRETKRIEGLSERLKKQQKELVGADVSWSSAQQIKKICRGNMALTIEDREHSKWVVDVIKRKQEPPKPVAKPRAEGEQEGDIEVSDAISQAGSGEESLGDSDDEDMEDEDKEMDGFVVDDTVDNVDNQGNALPIGPQAEEVDEPDTPVPMDLDDSDSGTAIPDISKSPSPAPKDVPKATPGRVLSRRMTPTGSQRQSIVPIDLCGSDDDDVILYKEERKTPGKNNFNERSREGGGVEIDLTRNSSPHRKSTPMEAVTLSDSDEDASRRQRCAPNPERYNPLQAMLESFDDETLAAILQHIQDWAASGVHVRKRMAYTKDALFRLPEPFGAMAKNYAGLSPKEEMVHRLVARCYIHWRYPKTEVPHDYRIMKRTWDVLDDPKQYERFIKEHDELVKTIHHMRIGDEDSDSHDKRRHGNNSDSDDMDISDEGGGSGHPKKRRRKVKEDAEARAQREKQAKTVREIARRYEQQQSREQELGSQGVVLINRGHKDDEADITIHPQLGGFLKPHQKEGIQFMWRQLVQIGENRGGLLAHTMGLGKTLQVITLLHTIATAAKSTDKRVYGQIPPHLRESKTIILCPPGLVENWWEEFHKWLPLRKDGEKGIDWSAIGQLRRADGSLSHKQRVDHIIEWSENGGVLLIGYALFRTFVYLDENGKSRVSDMDEYERIRNILLKEATIIIADEAHYLKNPEAKVTAAAKMFKYKTRIAMTGSPLSNNLEEYWSMIDWVDPGFLGPLAEFRGKYVRPIEDGLWADSHNSQKRESLKMMRVLKKDISPKIHRADISVIKNDLPQKTEFLITVPLTQVQKEFYRHYLNDIREDRSKLTTSQIFGVAYMLSLIVGHPAAFTRVVEERQDAIHNNMDILRRPAATDVDADVDKEDDHEERTMLLESAHLARPDHPWSRQLTDKYGDGIELSYKLMAFKLIIDTSIAIGDQILVFTHSVKLLDVLGRYLQGWNIDFQRLDGSTLASTRQKAAHKFNQGAKKVFLISTEAGGLGLNLPSANRVIIFDFKWSPMWEQQAIGRAYRLGQKKHVFVYRFLTGGSYEESLWNKTQFKEQLQSRVVDVQQPVRTAKKNMKEYLRDPGDIEKSPDLYTFNGMDTVLDSLLEADLVWDIEQTETFQRDEEDELTKEEQEDADRLQLEFAMERKRKAAEEKAFREMEKLRNKKAAEHMLQQQQIQQQLSAEAGASTQVIKDTDPAPNPFVVPATAPPPAKPDFSTLNLKGSKSTLMRGKFTPTPAPIQPDLSAKPDPKNSWLFGGRKSMGAGPPRPPLPMARKSLGDSTVEREKEREGEKEKEKGSGGNENGFPQIFKRGPTERRGGGGGAGPQAEYERKSGFR